MVVSEADPCHSQHVVAVDRLPQLTPEGCDPWNKGRLIGQKRPLKPKDVWTIRVRLQREGRKRDLAMFNLASRLKIDDVCRREGPGSSNGYPEKDGSALAVRDHRARP